MIECPHGPEWFEMTDAEKRPYIMRHDCQGGNACWNDIHRPRLELLKKCFGGLDTKIKPQDIDGSVERNGYFLFLEFKSGRGNFENQDNPRKKTALDIFHQALTSQVRVIHKSPLVLTGPTTTSVYVAGDSKTMCVEEIRIVHDGVFYDWEECDLYGLQVLCWEWFVWTKDISVADRARARAAVAENRPPNPWLKLNAKKVRLED